VRKVNIVSVELDDPLDEAGFRHDGATIGDRLGGQRIGASVYAAEAGDTIGPYHYHHGVEEWLYVISGEPVLRDAEGRRKLQPGDLVCFPSGAGGAHTADGPGRFIIFSTGTHREPWMSVYPDSGKVSGPEGILLASSRVDYWYGEGTYGRPTGPPVESGESELFPRAPIVNLGALEATPPEPMRPPGFRARQARLGAALNAQMLGASLYEIDPGEGSAAYHYEYGREEWLLVLSGTPTLRHPGGEDPLEAGDVVCFVEGPEGAHRVSNQGREAARVLMISTQDVPVTAHYPDSDKLLILDGSGQRQTFRAADAVDLWEGGT